MPSSTAITTPKSRWFRILCLLEVHGIPVGLQVGLGMRVARRLVHSSRGAGAGKGGRPWTDCRSERGADGATRGSGVRHFLLGGGCRRSTDGGRGAELRE